MKIYFVIALKAEESHCRLINVMRMRTSGLTQAIILFLSSISLYFDIVLQVYFQDLLSISASLLTCKEPAIRKFGINAYVLVFEEFTGNYHRQEVSIKNCIHAYVCHLFFSRNLEKFHIF